MSKHTIDDIQGLPEGWEAVAYRCPVKGEYFLPTVGNIVIAGHDYVMRYLIVQKNKSRQITLVETDEYFTKSASGYRVHLNGLIQFIDTAHGSDIGENIWRVNPCKEES